MGRKNLHRIVLVVLLLTVFLGACGSEEQAGDALAGEEVTAGGTVWLDNGPEKGIREDIETLLENVEVCVVSTGDLGDRSRCEFTDGGGQYEITFLNEDPDVDFFVLVNPGGLAFTDPDVGDDARDSDIDPQTGRGGADATAVDAGLLEPVEVSGGTRAVNGGNVTPVTPTPAATATERATEQPSTTPTNIPTAMPTITPTMEPTAVVEIDPPPVYKCETGEQVDDSALRVREIDLSVDESGENIVLDVTFDGVWSSIIVSLGSDGINIPPVAPSPGSAFAGSGWSAAVFGEDGVITGSAEATNTDSGPVFTESVIEGQTITNTNYFTNTGEIAVRYPTDALPGGATTIEAGVTDGTDCVFWSTPDADNSVARGLRELGVDLADRVADNPIHFCNPATSSCTASSVSDFTVDAAGNVQFTSPAGDPVTGFFGVGSEPPAARVAALTEVGWIFGANETYDTPHCSWAVHTLLFEDVERGNVALCEAANGTREVQLFVGEGADLAANRPILLELLDSFRGPR